MTQDYEALARELEELVAEALRDPYKAEWEKEGDVVPRELYGPRKAANRLADLGFERVAQRGPSTDYPLVPFVVAALRSLAEARAVLAGIGERHPTVMEGYRARNAVQIVDRALALARSLEEGS